MAKLDDYLLLASKFEDFVSDIDARHIAIRLYRRESTLDMQFEYAATREHEGPRPTYAPTVSTISIASRQSHVSDMPPAVFLFEKYFETAAQLAATPLLALISDEVGGLKPIPAVKWACWLTHIWGTRVLSRQLLSKVDILLCSPADLCVRAVKLLTRAENEMYSEWKRQEHEAIPECHGPTSGCVIDISGFNLTQR